MLDEPRKGSTHHGSRSWTHDDRADRLRVLGERSRLAVVCRLLEGPCRVSELNAQLGLEQSLLSHHLRVLRDAELVRTKRDGSSVIYRLAPDVHRSPAGSGIELGCCRITFDS